MALLISLETSSSRYARWASIPFVGAVGMFCVACLPLLAAIFASIPSILSRSGWLSSPTPWIALGTVAAALWNYALERRGLRFRFWFLPTWLVFSVFAPCCLVLLLLELTGVAGPFFQ